MRRRQQRNHSLDRETVSDACPSSGAQTLYVVSLVVWFIACPLCFADPPDWVDASTFGFDPNDATAALQAAIDTGAHVVFVPNMGTDWIIRPIFLNSSNQEILFEQGVVVTAKKNEFHGTTDSLFTGYDRSGITFTGYGATLRMHRDDYVGPDYTQSESRMGIRLYTVDNLLIQGLTIRDTGGDAIYLGVNQWYTHNKNIHIKDVLCDNNYRQGISVIDAENLLIENCIFRKTQGTAPEAGIDFEPDYAWMRLINCVVRNCVFDENIQGLTLNIFSYMDDEQITGSIENCTFIGNYYYGIRQQQGYLPNWTIKDCLFVNNGYQASPPYPGVGFYVLDVEGPEPVTVDYCAFWGNRDGPIAGYGALGVGCVTGQEPVFVSTDVNDPLYMYLSPDCPAAITHGAYDGGYIGARPVAAEKTIFRPLHLADGTPDEMNGYQKADSLAPETGSPDWDSSTYPLAWIADDFSAGEANMMLIRFGDLFGDGPIQVPADANILSAKLNVNVWVGYLAPASVIRCHTGLTDWYTTYGDTDFSTAAWRKHDAGLAWNGGVVADAPRHGIDYTATSVDVAVDFPQGSGTYQINQFVTFDVTSDVIAYQKGTLANNGWWIGTNQALALGKYRLATTHSGWSGLPWLEIYWNAATCADVPDDQKNIADFNKDCVVNWADFAIFAANWLDCRDPAGCP